MANTVPVSKPLLTDPETFSTPLDSETVRLPLDGLKPLPAGQLIVNVPLKFSALRLAWPDMIAVIVPVPLSAPVKMSAQPLVVPVRTAWIRGFLYFTMPGE